MIHSTPFPYCCGLNLLHGEQYYTTPEAYFKDFAAMALTHKKMPSLYSVGALVFEHKANNEIGVKISEYVEKNGLGVVHRSPPIPNPVHGGRAFHVYTWIHDHTALKKHLAELVKPVVPPPATVSATPPAAPAIPTKAPPKAKAPPFPPPTGVAT